VIVYLVTNKINGKKYVGITKKTLEQRKSQHIYVAKTEKGAKFQHALRKYGEDGFSWEVIDKASTYEELLEKEIYYIEKYDSFRNGYNSTLGGEGFNGFERPTGEEHPSSVLTEKDVEFIYTSTLSDAETAKLFNISRSAIYAIRNKRAWTNVTDKLTQFPVSKQMVVEMYLSPMDAEHLAEEYYCSVDFADKVKKGIYYSELTKRFG
jgi:predicted DNA-binding protein YlxM (UPF0122 family)